MDSLCSIPNMQQQFGYPVLWMNQAERPPVFTHASMYPPPPFPDFKKKKRKDGTWVCLLIIFLLVLLALAGLGLGMYKLFELQKQLDQVKELSSNAAFMLPPSTAKLIGGTLEKKESRQAAHVTGTNSPNLPLAWEDSRGRAFTAGIQYKNKGLVVNETGLHFLYSSIYFQNTECPSEVLELTHTVYKKTPLYPSVVKLMENKDYHNCKPRVIWGRQSYLGAVFNLTRSDVLYVNVSDVKLVNYEETKTFFGLYKL